MEQLNKTPTTGKFSDVAKVLDTNFGLIVAKMVELEQGHEDFDCGFYSSASELRTAYPNPKVGMMAYVGSGTDYVVYRCKTDGTWIKTEEPFKINITVDLSTYATSAALKVVSDKVDGLMLGAVYRGMATTITNPGTPQTKVFYLPTEVGTYTNFGNLAVGENEVAFLYYDGQVWFKHSLDLSGNIAAIKKTADDAAINAKNAFDKAGTAIENAKTAQSTADANTAAIEKTNERIGKVEQDLEDYPKIVYLTEEEYDDLEVKDGDTLYYLSEEE